MTTEPKTKRQPRTKTAASTAEQQSAPSTPDTEQDKVNQTPAQPNANPEQPAAIQNQSEGADNGQQDKAPADDPLTDAEIQPADNKGDDASAADKEQASPAPAPVTEPVAVAPVKPVHAFEVTNNSDQRVFEPVTRTTIAPVETKTIECINASFKQRALSNLKQFQALGRNLEIKEDASST
ncbi:RodZ family helix-turn-helix domain-containing protein [Alkanindiges illinoisensis]|uniref:hypothetical protein n=1 Tax=Alkanindiges illinoisensis TaxID=197183 RepID=UPI000478B811|nr:hypothetical protein [Alkanindiges illinoisensis]